MTPAIETVEALDEYRADVLDKLMSRVFGVFIGKRTLREAAAALREADERAGLVTVPREPTEVMLCVGRSNQCNNVTAIREVIKASPFASAAQVEGGE